jgi:hypothetical protein
MKQLLILLLIASISSGTYGQKHDNIWPMGYAYDSIINPCNYYIDFTDSFQIINRCLGIKLIQLGNSAISDSTGNLLFYTNGCLIADSSHQVMLNGTGLNNMIDPLYIEDGYPAKTLILPNPNSSNLYYIFHLEFPTNSNGQISYGLPLWLNYSLVDMNGNGGLGEVVLKNIPLINDTIEGNTSLSATKHANGIDWWILVPGCCSSNIYYRFLLTQDSIYGPFFQEVSIPTIVGAGGQSVFSPDGSLYVRYLSFGKAYIHDFNRCTGELSFKQEINPPVRINVPGLAISPNSRFLYLCNDTIVFQYDLQAADINASRVIVCVFDWFMSPFYTNFWQLQLASNGKIYGVSSGGTDRLHVIENPDSAGLACNFRQHAIITPRYNGISLPNLPHFRTPALPPGACDTTGVVQLAGIKEEIKIYPNPSHNGSFNIAWQGAADRVQLYDMLGRLCYETVLPEYAQESELDTALGKGIYLIVLKNNGNLVGREKIVILD